MKALGALVAVVLILLGGAAAWYFAPGGDDDTTTVDLTELQGELTGSACRRMAGVSAKLAERDPAPIAYLRAMGLQVAGIRPPPRGYGDLARGGSNRIPGRGFLARLDDGSSGQARHFAGIVAATTFVGGSNPTRWISESLRRDPADSADGRLTEEGIEFATSVARQDLALDETPAWLLAHLCRRN